MSIVVETCDRSFGCACSLCAARRDRLGIHLPPKPEPFEAFQARMAEEDRQQRRSTVSRLRTVASVALNLACVVVMVYCLVDAVREYRGKRDCWSRGSAVVYWPEDHSAWTCALVTRTEKP